MLVNNNLVTQRSSCISRSQVEKGVSLFVHIDGGIFPIHKFNTPQNAKGDSELFLCGFYNIAINNAAANHKLITQND